MKKTLFIAHDPGGFDAVYPVVRRYERENLFYEFYGIGPSATKLSANALTSAAMLEKVQQEICENAIEALITGTSWGNDSELEAIKFCKSRRIPTISLLDYWANYKERFRALDGSYIFPDFLIVMDDLAFQEAVADGVPQEIIRILGHPGLDAWTEMDATISGQAEQSNDILFLSQPLSTLYGDALGFTEFDVMEDLLAMTRRLNRYKIHVRFHPKDSELFRTQYGQFEINEDFTTSIREHEYVIGMSTIALLHAALAGKSVISYQPNLQNIDDCITNKLGLSVSIGSFDELLSYFMHFPKESTCFSAVNYTWLDGRSTDRVYRFIREAIHA
jgi:hypothetical protein